MLVSRVTLEGARCALAQILPGLGPTDTGADLPALFEQMHHLGALRAQRGRSLAGSVDRASPYFGHMRLEETDAGLDLAVHQTDAASNRRVLAVRAYLDQE